MSRRQSSNELAGALNYRFMDVQASAQLSDFLVGRTDPYRINVRLVTGAGLPGGRAVDYGASGIKRGDPVVHRAHCNKAVPGALVCRYQS